MNFIAAIRRYFKLRATARRMQLPVAWWWSNERVLLAMFDERIRRGQCSFEKRAKILDFRSYTNAERRSNVK